MPFILANVVPSMGILLLVLHSGKVNMFYCIRLGNKKTLKVARQDQNEPYTWSISTNEKEITAQNGSKFQPPFITK